MRYLLLLLLLVGCGKYPKSTSQLTAEERQFFVGAAKCVEIAESTIKKNSDKPDSGAWSYNSSRIEKIIDTLPPILDEKHLAIKKNLRELEINLLNVVTPFLFNSATFSRDDNSDDNKRKSQKEIEEEVTSRLATCVKLIEKINLECKSLYRDFDPAKLSI